MGLPWIIYFSFLKGWCEDEEVSTLGENILLEYSQKDEKAVDMRCIESGISKSFNPCEGGYCAFDMVWVFFKLQLRYIMFFIFG